MTLCYWIPNKYLFFSGWYNPYRMRTHKRKVYTLIWGGWIILALWSVKKWNTFWITLSKQSHPSWDSCKEGFRWEVVKWRLALFMRSSLAAYTPVVPNWLCNSVVAHCSHIQKAQPGDWQKSNTECVLAPLCRNLVNGRERDKGKSQVEKLDDWLCSGCRENQHLLERLVYMVG